MHATMRATVISSGRWATTTLTQCQRPRTRRHAHSSVMTCHLAMTSSSSSRRQRRRGEVVRVNATGDYEEEAEESTSSGELELNLGRAAMLGFLGTTVGDVLTRGEGPIEQLAAEGSYFARHVNPLEVAKDALEVAGFYVESVVLVWFMLGSVLLLGVSQGLRNPIKTVSGKSTKQRAEAALSEIEKAYEVNAREQKPYELFNGRLAMLGTAFAFIGDVKTGGLGPLEQVNQELGIPVIDEEIFAVIFLLGVTYNVVATGVTAARRAYAKSRE